MPIATDTSTIVGRPMLAVGQSLPQTLTVWSPDGLALVITTRPERSSDRRHTSSIKNTEDALINTPATDASEINSDAGVGVGPEPDIEVIDAASGNLTCPPNHR